MRNGILLGSMLNNSETWINLTKKNIEELEKPDKLLRDRLFESKPSTVFYYLELGIIPAKYVILKKRLKFLKYIIDEDMNSMIRRVYEEQRKESIKGDFIHLVKEDLKDLQIEIEDSDIRKYSKAGWNKFINEITEKVVLRKLLEENNTKSKTKYLKYEKLEMRQYLRENRNT